MVAQPVEWVLVVYYGPAAHQAIYGRQVRRGGYTKDYIQLSRKPEFLETMTSLFSVAAGTTNSVPLTYRWPGGAAPGEFVFRSADRPHLKWETSHGAPQVWRMALSPSDSVAETIPGDPSHADFVDAENEFALLASRGAGQPYLVVTKLLSEPKTLHLRAYLKGPNEDFAWADLNLLPQEVQALAASTSQRSALAWSLFQNKGEVPSAGLKDALAQLAASESPVSEILKLDEETNRRLARYLRAPGYGLFFDPTKNHDAWSRAVPLSPKLSASIDVLLRALEAYSPQGDAVAERLEADPEEVEIFRQKIEQQSYEVADSLATVKTRGSAQRVFSEVVKNNYENRCAVTGIVTRDFLVASHIVPWSEDQSIRLDPSNGICLSLLVDRAFEKGYLLIADDLTIHIDWSKVGGDEALRAQLEPYDGRKLRASVKEPPHPEYLSRRRAFVDQ
jgi:hypothetical protein